jgi:hypothetical protein
MSYLTLLFPSQSQGMVKVSEPHGEAEREVPTRPNPGEKAWTGAGNVPDDCRLRSGIVSMEHWLDLNA